jgi:hypothetical protein
MYMSNSNGDLVIQYYWLRKHKVERLCGARAAATSCEVDVHLTFASVRASNCPTKSLYVSSSGHGRTRSAYKPNVNHKCRLNKLDEMERQIESER